MTVLRSDLNPEEVARFFWYARERQSIFLKRRAGLPRPWTDEPTMSRYRITNVFRERDKTTEWFRQHVRDPLRDEPVVLLATVIFRWFNTIRTGETLFLQKDMFNGRSAFEEYLVTGDKDALLAPLRRQGPPWVTGAYMIKSLTGMDKLEGIVEQIDMFTKAVLSDSANGKQEWFDVADMALRARDTETPDTLQGLWSWLKRFEGQGPFLAYEVVTDMRFTKLFDKAPDIMTWANPGPGALRGANLILRGAHTDPRTGRLVKASYPETHDVMAHLLELSRDPRYWPQEVKPPEGYDGEHLMSDEVRLHIQGVPGALFAGAWPSWEMREPEMWLCEFAKLERTRLGLGRPRGTYP